MPLATVFTKSCKWHCASQLHIPSQNFQCSAFFSSHVSICDQSCQVKDVLIFMLCQSLYGYLPFQKQLLNHHGSKEDSLPYSPRLLISFSHSKIVLFFKCFPICLSNVGCKDQVRVICIIIIFMYIFDDFSFVNYLYEGNKLSKKSSLF